MEILEGYTNIPELSNCDDVMQTFAQTAVEDVLADPHSDIIAPLNGSIVPLYYAIEYFVQTYPTMHLSTLTDRIFFMHDQKDENGHISSITFDRPFAPTSTLHLFDDIADKLGVAAKLSEICRHLKVVVPVQKMHTAGYLETINSGSVHLNATVTTGNGWIASGCGMNEGADGGTGYQKALLSTLQRFARIGLYKDDGNTMSIEQKIALFEAHLLPFVEKDDLFDHCLMMELQKNKGNTDCLFDLNRLLLRKIVKKIRDQH